MSNKTSEKPPSILTQAVTGVVPPGAREARIRTAWPTVMDASPMLANLAAMLIRTRLLAPLAWLILAPLFIRKISPVVAKRYVLTNQAVKIQRGLTAKTKQEIKLADIDEIRLEDGSYQPHYHSANLEIYSGGKLEMKLTAVPEPQGFRHAILNTMTAWIPEKAKALPMLPASEFGK